MELFVLLNYVCIDCMQSPVHYAGVTVYLLATKPHYLKLIHLSLLYNLLNHYGLKCNAWSTYLDIRKEEAHLYH